MLKIGIVAQNQPEEKFGVNSNYLEWIYNFGRPVVILPETYDDFKEIYKLDALVLPGGADVDYKRYSNLPALSNLQPNTFLEHFDNNILPKLFKNMPIFGICRGLQTLNVFCGGSLRNLWWHPYSSFDSQEVHSVWTPEMKFDKNKFYMKVNSFHHQGIRNLARNFKVELEDKEDNVVEAISDYASKVFAVQWHPERLDDDYSKNMFKFILK